MPLQNSWNHHYQTNARTIRDKTNKNHHDHYESYYYYYYCYNSYYYFYYYFVTTFILLKTGFPCREPVDTDEFRQDKTRLKKGNAFPTAAGDRHGQG